MNSSSPVAASDIVRRFAIENRLDPAAVTVGDAPPAHRDGYRLLAGRTADSRQPLLRQLAGLQIDAVMRWGNSLVQLSNAIEIAARHGIARVYAPDFWWVSPHAGTDGTGITVEPGPAPAGAAVLAGRFYYRDSLAPLYATKGKSIEAIRENLLRVRGQIPLLAPRPAWPEDHLVIHIRAGDVFEGAGHPLYGQPPLAFYTLVLKALPWRRVTLVCEDRANPVVDALLAWRQPGVPPVEYRAGSLAEDLEILLSATSLVASLGTFMPAVLALSANARRVACFENIWYGQNLHQHAELLVVRDVAGGYSPQVLVRNWRNTANQRALMLEYPQRNLRLVRSPRP